MTKAKVLYDFFNSFSIPAYPNTSVPDNAVMPYITYDIVLSDFLGLPTSLTINIWYKTESESLPNNKVKDIEQKIGIGGILLDCDEGVLWIKKGSPWCTNMTDVSDKSIKRRYLNVTVEHLTL